MAKKRKAQTDDGVTGYSIEAEMLGQILDTLKRIESRLMAVSSPIIQHPYLQMQKLPPQEYKKI